MKRGFTLIELLAVIAVLAIIMIIATPRILDAIENSRISAYQQDEQMMIKATETYFGNNAEQLPENIGDTVEITLNDLKTNEMISEINDCNGYILVTKTEKGYSYNPQLKCGTSNTIGTSIDDKMVLNYDFNEFAEPTENLEPNPITFATGYDGGGTQWFEKSVVEFDGKTCLKYVVNCPGGNTGWTGSYVGLDAKNMGVVGDYFTRSVWYYVEEGGVSVSRPYISMTHSGWSEGVNSFYDMTKTGTWQYLAATGKLNDLSENTNAYLYLFGKAANDPTDVNFTIYVWHPQMEKKDYATPFVDGERIATILDKSINNNNANLELPSTPKWQIDDERNNGSYYFDGFDKFMVADNDISLQTSNALTISSWIKPDETQEESYPRIVDKYKYLTHITQSPPYTATFNIYTISGLRQSAVGNIIEPNVWTHLVTTYDGRYSKIYINGRLEMEKDWGKNESIEISNNQFYVGDNDGGTASFKGSMDDIKIYNRVLSAEEIKYQYDTTK